MKRRTGFRRGWSRRQPTQAQRCVLDALLEGKTNAAIASRLGLSPETVKWHISEVLAETGLSDRQELAGWWQRERDSRRPGILAGLLGLRRLPVAVILLVAGVVLVGGWLRWGRDGGGEAGQAPVEQVPVDEGVLAGAAIQQPAPLFTDFLVELTVELPPSGSSRVDLRDITTGQKLASVEAGYRPMVLVRRQARELLVAAVTNSEQVNRRAGPEQKVLAVYDLDNYSLKLKRTIALPDRINCTTFCQPMVLSRDERYLYYDSIRGICPSGGDASVCDAHAITIVDLNQADAPPVMAPLPMACGVPILNPAGATDVVVTCRGQYPIELGWIGLIGPDGTIARTVDFASERPYNREPVISRMKVSPSFGTLTGAGELAVILQEGQVLKEAPDGSRTRGRLLPDTAPPVARIATVHDLGGDRLFVVYSDGAWGTRDPDPGFVVFNLRTMTMERQGSVPPAESYLPRGESVFVLRENRVEVLDLAGGQPRVLTDSVEPGVEVLLPGR